MKLIVGLGNPGPTYAGHRHNIGFMGVDVIADLHGFGPWRGRFQGMVSEGRLGGEAVMLLKPGTFMNDSGQSVGAAARFFKLAMDELIVLHDELDLVPGRVKVKIGGGAAGHNGLRSIDQHLDPEYTRVRLGIGHPGHKDQVTPYVLGDFAKTDRVWLADTLDAVAIELPWVLKGDSERFMTEVARRTGGD